MEKQALEEISEPIINKFTKALFLTVAILPLEDEEKADVVEAVAVNLFLRVIDNIYNLELHQDSADYLGNKLDELLAETIKSIKTAPKRN